MAEFNIVHLSDLHIKGNYLSATLTNLISSIKKQTEGMKNIILVVSGDVIDKGQYMTCLKQDCKEKKLNETALSFFRQLKTALEDWIELPVGHLPQTQTNSPITNGNEKPSCKQWLSKRVIDVQIVSGNHDKDISPQYIKIASERFQKDEDFVGDKAQWEFEELYFKDFINFTNEVYNIFELPKGINKGRVKQFEGGTDGESKESCDESINEIREECNLIYDSDDMVTKCKKNPKCKYKYKHIDKTFGVEFIELPCLSNLIDAENRKPNSHTFRCGKTQERYNCRDQRPDLTLAFIRMNTAWLSCGGAEEIEKHHLAIGQHQLLNLVDEYQSEYIERTKREEQIITICIGHHPPSYFKPLEEDAVKEHLLDKELLNADYYLCGHTHERTVSSLVNKGRRVTTLVTGIGWDHRKENPKDTVQEVHKDTHSYSIYTFNEEQNIQISKMFRTNLYGDFEEDNSYYNTDIEKRLKRQSSPLYLHDYPFIELNGYGHSVNEIFVDREILEKIKELEKRKDVFEKACDTYLRRLLFINANEVFKNYEDSDGNIYEKTEYKSNRTDDPKSKEELLEEIQKTLKETTPKDIKDATENSDNFNTSCLFSKDIDNLFKKILRIRKSFKTKELDEKHHRDETFKEYLEHIALTFIETFKVSFPDDDIRIVIRRHNNDDTFKEVAVYPTKKRKDETPPTIEEEQYIIDDVYTPKNTYRWADNKRKLITAHAFEGRSPRIYTLNKELLDFTPDRWQDFMVIAPYEFEYIFATDEDGSEEERRPSLTFVFSVTLNSSITRENNFIENKKMFKELSNKLYLMEYIGIDQTIINVIRKFKPSIGFSYK